MKIRKIKLEECRLLAFVQNLCISRGEIEDKTRANLLYKGVLVSTLELPNKRKKSVERQSQRREDLRRYVKLNRISERF